MGHSDVIGRKTRIDVRDSTFEVILERVLDELRSNPEGQSKVGSATVRLVEGWLDEWIAMPPGCKEVDVSNVDPMGVCLLMKAVGQVLHKCIPGSETQLLTQRFFDLVSEQSIAGTPE